MIYLIVGTICFSLSFGLIKAQLVSLPPEFVVFVRLMIATIIFSPFVRNFKLTQQLKAIAIGAIQFGVMYLCFIKAFQYLQGNEIAVLTTTTPIFVLLWSTLLGEKFKFIYICCILLSVIGACIIVWQNVSFNVLLKGILLMETSNCTFALGQVLWKKYVGITHENLIAAAYLGATLFVLPFVLINVHIYSLHITCSQMLSILYLAIIPTGLGFWLWNKGASRVTYSVLAIINNIKIPLGVLFAIILFHEKVNFLHFITGTFVILIAFLWLQYSQNHLNK